MLRRVLDGWKGFQAFRSIPRRERRIVFYSEGGEYWTHFEPVFTALRELFGESVLYVTSSSKDPILLAPPKGIRPFYIGAGSIRTIFFSSLDVDVLLMTMPDLETFHIKRSPHSVRYIYLQHSMVSSHMVYRSEAFDHFDAILCAGPHHEHEIRAREQLKRLPKKDLIQHGYGRLDAIIAEYARVSDYKLTKDVAPHVLVAPSWGENGLLEQYGKYVVQNLIDSGIQTTVRPHPRTRIMRPDVMQELLICFGDNPLFSLDEDVSGRASLFAADLMISDWSGAALEFSLGLGRPVIFVDVPQKVRNKDYGDLCMEPLEVNIRDKLGIILPISQMEKIGSITLEVVHGDVNWQQLAQEFRQQWIFNLGKSGKVAASYVYSVITTLN